MKESKFMVLLLLFCLFNISNVFAQKTPEIIKGKQSNAFQMMVNGKPFLMLGGELSNSATSDKIYMNLLWPELKKININTVLAPVYWELTEPIEGKFDFSLVDEMLELARENDLKLVLLWFGSWKNSMSCYAPGWLKQDYKRFPRTLNKKGEASEIISAFSESNLKADLKAFVALMAHLKAVDADRQTVIMIQVENEIGQLPEPRDYSSAANKAFLEDVPRKLIDYLNNNRKNLLPHVKQLWEKNGYKQNGNWKTVFGEGLSTDEMFTAWYDGVYADKVAEAGKAVYPIPMYVNCALNRPHIDPGKYPAGGPLPHLINIWKAAAPNLDMLSPDIYFGDFRDWCRQYDLQNNPVFIPEIKLGEENAAQVFYVIGHHKAIGFSPFSIESNRNEEHNTLKKSYRILNDLSELILADRSKTDGVYFDKQHKADTLTFGNYQLIIAHEYTLGWSKAENDEDWMSAGCIVIEKSPGEFWIGGTGVVCTFRNAKNEELTTGILSADVCTKDNNSWIFKRLNGDQTHQGRHTRISSGEWVIQRIRLYDYK